MKTVAMVARALLLVTVVASCAVTKVSGEPSPVSRTIYIGASGLRTVQQAVNVVPANNTAWVRNHVAAGVYREKVSIVNKPYVLPEGEGRERTIIECGGGASLGLRGAIAPLP
uniref:Pectinesterase n=1 Tax=Aegilops tauschii TaxID=37682 RepID=M8D6B9_AEGTA